jgi:hypothetical protein
MLLLLRRRLKTRSSIVHRIAAINLHQKGANMNTRLRTGTWMYRVVIGLGLIAAVSVISAGGLSRLLISPLNSGLLE